jgi:NTP pyrophosphatase (non-canonical NTP hydrolase)
MDTPLVLTHKIEQFQEVNSRIFPREFTKSHIAFLTAQCHSELSELYNASRNFLGREMSPEKTGGREELVDEFGDTLGVLLAIGRVMNISLEEALDTVTAKLIQLETKKNANTVADHNQEPYL